MRKTIAIALIALLSAVPVAAQGRGKGKSKKVPPGHLPSAGQCRVWYDGVPPGHQPVPTNCANAERIAARDGARVVYSNGESAAGSGDVWGQSGGGGVIPDRDGRRDRTPGRGDSGTVGEREKGSRDRGGKPATGRAIPRGTSGLFWPFGG